MIPKPKWSAQLAPSYMGSWPKVSLSAPCSSGELSVLSPGEERKKTGSGQENEPRTPLNFGVPGVSVAQIKMGPEPLYFR